MLGVVSLLLCNHLLTNAASAKSFLLHRHSSILILVSLLLLLYIHARCCCCSREVINYLCDLSNLSSYCCIQIIMIFDAWHTSINMYLTFSYILNCRWSINHHCRHTEPPQCCTILLLFLCHQPQYLHDWYQWCIVIIAIVTIITAVMLVIFHTIASCIDTHK